MKMFKTGLVLSVMLWLLAITGSATAQTNLLVNGGLEEDSFGRYEPKRTGTHPIYLPTGGWGYWLAPQSGDFINRGDKVAIWPNPGPGPNPTEGRRALSIDCGFVTCTVVLFQTVSVAEKTNVEASAQTQVKACNLAPNATSCGSAVESGAQTRIGIDPNGGNNPLDSDIVWSAWNQPHDRWQGVSVSATTTGTQATVFLYSTQGSVAHLNKAYWDDVKLTTGGTGGTSPSAATAVPTAPPVVAFVVPQNAQDDGSIVHVVQTGDTVDSIAFAYGVTRAEILQLNNIGDPRLISVGQRLKIKEAEAPPPTEPPAATEVESVAAVPTTDSAAVEPTTDSAAVEPTADSAAVEPTQAPEVQPTEAPPVDEQPVEVQPTADLATAPVISASSGLVQPPIDAAAQTASVCVLLFNDANQNRIQETDEALLPGGNINLLLGGAPAGTYDTDGLSEPHCFSDLGSGSYVAAAAAPEGFGLTTPDQLRVQLVPGASINLAFGAAEGLQPVVPPPADTGGVVEEVTTPQTENVSAVNQLLNVSGLIVFGLAAVVLIGGVGLTLLLRRR